MRHSLGFLVTAVAVMWVWALDLASSSTAPPTGRSGPSPVVAQTTQLFSPPPPPTGATTAAPGGPPDREAAGELRPAVRSTELEALHERYARETRDSAWAFEQEQRVSALFANHPLAAHVVLLNCQTTVCQLVLEGDAPDLVEQLGYVPNLRRETDLRPDSPYSLRNGQLSLYFQRAPLPSDDQAEQASKTSR